MSVLIIGYWLLIDWTKLWLWSRKIWKLSESTEFCFPDYWLSLIDQLFLSLFFFVYWWRFIQRDWSDIGWSVIDQWLISDWLISGFKKSLILQTFAEVSTHCYWLLIVDYWNSSISETFWEFYFPDYWLSAHWSFFFHRCFYVYWWGFNQVELTDHWLINDRLISGLKNLWIRKHL